MPPSDWRRGRRVVIAASIAGRWPSAGQGRGSRNAGKARLTAIFSAGGITRFSCAFGAAGETCKETLLRKASESTAHVSEAGRPLKAGNLSRVHAGFLLQIKDLEKEPGIRNPFGAACGPLRTSPERGGSGACGRLPNGPGARISLRYTHILYFTTAHRVCKRFLQKKAGDFAA